ncbi:MAG: DUF21 domain-containing protein [Planctomycetia bacterium]|nr:DUF21 domain-containing protein [Planctomycetia bacterium]
MLWGITLFALGLAASFLFSGTETGFYRLSRARLILNGIRGERSSRFLLWLVNRPAFFLSTVLVGNNVFNGLVSMGAVLVCQALFSGSSADRFASLVVVPIVFIYGELLPKNVFLASPDRLMKRCVLPLAFFTVLFLPISLLLWLVNRFLAKLLGQTSRTYSLEMTRKELKQFFGEGEAVGILRPTQQMFADTLLAVEHQPAGNWSVPLSRVPSVAADASPDTIRRAMRDAGTDWIAVRTPNGWGYYRFSDGLETGEFPRRELCRLPMELPVTRAFGRLMHDRDPVALLVNRRGKVVGAVLTDVLRKIFM